MDTSNLPNNALLHIALDFVNIDGDVLPEHVLYGYAKLLCMKEDTYSIFVPSDKILELKSVKRYCDSKGIITQKLRDVLSYFIANPKDDEREEEAFEDFQETISDHYTKRNSLDIFMLAYKSTYINWDYFTDPNITIDDVIKKEQEKISASKEEDDSDDIASFLEALKGLEADEQKLEDLKENVEAESSSSETPEETSSPNKDGKRQTVEDLMREYFGEEAAAVGNIKPTDDKKRETGKKKPEAVSKETPKSESLDTLAIKYRKLTIALLDKVKGQDNAVMKFVQGCYQGELEDGSNKKEGPKAHFFFVGPSGVGKTYLAKTAAKALGLPNKIYNMSEYSDKQSLGALIGIDKSFNGGDAKINTGDLVSFVNKNQECLIVFDEIEKASIEVIRIFLSILGSGNCRDAFTGNMVDFSKAIIIFTSNLGKELYDNTTAPLTTLPDKVVLDAIKNDIDPQTNVPKLPAEIISRIGSGVVTMFNHLSVAHLNQLATDSITTVCGQLKEKFNCDITFEKDLPLFFLFTRGSNIDARLATTKSSAFMFNELYELTRQLDGITDGKSDIKTVDFKVDFSDMDKELEPLFHRSEKTEILIVASKQIKQLMKFDETKYILHYATTLEEAEKEAELMDNGLIFIDPTLNLDKKNEKALSASDYASDGTKFFKNMIERENNFPIYIINNNSFLKDIDIKTFDQLGSRGTIEYKNGDELSFIEKIQDLAEEQYLEFASQDFCRRGFVIGYSTKQIFDRENGSATILFYDLKRKLALDMESRNTILGDMEKPDVKFKDVIGSTKAKEELQFFINYLKKPKEFAKKGIKPAKGILLYGPPGTGKTMLAKAMAGESNVTFIQTSATDFKKKYHGEGEELVRNLFNIAKKHAPAVIFIDEIDSIGKRRSEENASDASLLNALLTQIDGFETSVTRPVFVLCATNFGVGDHYKGIGELDPALVRRFDNKIYIDLPNKQERSEFVNYYLNKKKISTIHDDTIDNIASRTTGLSIAIIQNVLSLAVRNALKEGRIVVDNDLLTALEDYLYGEKKENSLEYYKSVAIHETGHAFISYLSGIKPSYITIESRGDFGGYMMRDTDENKGNYTKDDIIGMIRTSLAGRAAEIVFFGEDAANNTGASSDLQHATDLAFEMILSYGMEKRNLVVLGKSEIMKSSIASSYIEKVNDILNREMDETIRIISENKQVIQKIADELVSNNHLTGDEFIKLVK